MTISTLADVKTWIGINDTSQDAMLNLLIPSVNAMIVEYCETDFTKKRVKAEVIDAQRSDMIITENFPIIEVNAISVGCDADGTGGTALDVEKDVVVRKHEIALRHQYTPRGRGFVVVDYNYGYATVPPQVKQASLLACEAMYYRKSRKTIGIRSRGKEGETESYSNMWDDASGLPSEVVQMLQPFKFIEFPVSPMATRNW